MNIIFTDIDGVLNSAHKNKWLPNAISIYNRICDEFELRVVITSTWRTNHTKRHLQNIFDYYGIEQDIYDYTPILPCQPRGVEIETWISENSPSKWVVIDDHVNDIIPYVTNVIKCRGWLGLTEDEYLEIKKLFI